MEEVESFSIDLETPRRLYRLKKTSQGSQRVLLMNLCKNLDVFTWKREDMVGIDPKVSYHHLTFDPKFTSHRLYISLNPEQYEALKEDVNELVANGFIKEANYPQVSLKSCPCVET